MTVKAQWCNFERAIKSKNEYQTRCWSISKPGNKKAENHRTEKKKQQPTSNKESSKLNVIMSIQNYQKLSKWRTTQQGTLQLSKN